MGSEMCIRDSDYSVPGAEEDFIPQDVPNEKVKLMDGYTELGVEKT